VEQREAYKDRQEKRLMELQALIERFKAEEAKEKEEGISRRENVYRNLQGKERQVRKMLDELEKAGEGAWQKLESGVEEAVSDLQKAVEKALSAFRPRPGE
jgi:hypothetical protein